MSSSNTKPTMSKLQSGLLALVGHLTEVLPASVRTLVINNQSLTPQQIVAKAQAGLDLYAAADSAKEAAKEAVARRKAAEPALKEMWSQVEALLRVILGTNTSALAKVGMAPRKKTGPMSVEARAAGVIKGRATRQRNTPKAKPGDTIVLYGADGQPVNASDLPSAATPAAGSTSSKA
jgi:hypothetical protein